MLRTPDGRPRCAVVTIAHLDDEQRQSSVSVVLAKLISWMRRQSGTSDLRTLLYMDEVAGYLPPNGNPPTKPPIMLLLKQARAFGVGVVLSTQNPVDVDYKALSNAGTWMIGRLQTEQDKARLVDGLTSAAGSVDPGAVGDTISGLGKREFVMKRASKDTVSVFTTRWAMSYLRGPLTREQIRSLKAARPRRRRRLAAPPRCGPGGSAPAAPAPVAGPRGRPPPLRGPARCPGPPGAPAAPAAPAAPRLRPRRQPPPLPSAPLCPGAPRPTGRRTSAPASPLAADETPVQPKVADGSARALPGPSGQLGRIGRCGPGSPAHRRGHRPGAAALRRRQGRHRARPGVRGDPDAADPRSRPQTSSARSTTTTATCCHPTAGRRLPDPPDRGGRQDLVDDPAA